MSRWPMVSLREVMTPRQPDISVSSEAEYQFAGIYCFGGGAFVAQKKNGLEFAYKRLTQLQTNDFTYPKLMAWEGAFAIIPTECDGLVVSPEFPVFRIDQTRAVPQYIGYYFKRASVWAAVAGQSTGTNVRRRRLHPRNLLKHHIPLPPLREQQRIVESLDALNTKIDEANSKATEIEQDSRSLLLSAFHQITRNASRHRLGDIAPLVRRPAIVDPFAEYPGVSVRSFGKGTFHNPPLQGSDITWEKPQLVHAGDVLISNIKAWEGAIAVAQPKDDGRYGSHRYLTYVPIPDVATARFICFFLLTSEGLHHVGKASPGSADRNRTTSAKSLLEIPVPLPNYQQQLWFGELFDKVETVQQLQAETMTERQVLLPAILNRSFNGGAE